MKTFRKCSWCASNILFPNMHCAVRWKRLKITGLDSYIKLYTVETWHEIIKHLWRHLECLDLRIQLYTQETLYEIIEHFWCHYSV